MTDAEETLRWHDWWRDKWTESRPAPAEMSDTERIDWLRECCDRYEYIKPRHVITDCLGQRTVAANYRDAIDMAKAKYDEANR